MTDLEGRILNPAVLLTMIASGLAYSRLLWSVNLRPTATLLVVGLAPGAIFLLTMFSIRAMQGRPSLIWPYLMADWFVFSGSAVVAVLIARRRHHR